MFEKVRIIFHAYATVVPKKKEEEEKKEGGSAVAEGKLENYLRTRQPSLYGMLVKNKVFNPGL